MSAAATACTECAAADRYDHPKFTQEEWRERLDVAFDAACEIEHLVRHLNTHLPTEEHQEYQFLRALVIRINDLNSLVLSVHGGDDFRETKKMRGVLYGPLDRAEHASDDAD